MVVLVDSCTEAIKCGAFVLGNRVVSFNGGGVVPQWGVDFWEEGVNGDI